MSAAESACDIDGGFGPCGVSRIQLNATSAAVCSEAHSHCGPVNVSSRNRAAYNEEATIILSHDIVPFLLRHGGQRRHMIGVQICSVRDNKVNPIDFQTSQCLFDNILAQVDIYQTRREGTGQDKAL